MINSSNSQNHPQAPRMSQVDATDADVDPVRSRDLNPQIGELDWRSVGDARRTSIVCVTAGVPVAAKFVGQLLSGHHLIRQRLAEWRRPL